MAKKRSVAIDIQYQIKIAGDDESKTYEYNHVGRMSAAKASASDPLKREENLLKFLVKEFKQHARKQRKKLAKEQKLAKKSRS